LAAAVHCAVHRRDGVILDHLGSIRGSSCQLASNAAERTMIGRLRYFRDSGAFRGFRHSFKKGLYEQPVSLYLNIAREVGTLDDLPGGPGMNRDDLPLAEVEQVAAVSL